MKQLKPNVYPNGVTKRLCFDCPYAKKSFGKNYCCKLYNKGNKVLGIYIWMNKVHPKCPLATMTYQKLIKIAHYYKYEESWAYYRAKDLGLSTPRLTDTCQQKTEINKGGDK